MKFCLVNIMGANVLVIGRRDYYYEELKEVKTIQALQDGHRP